MCVYANVCLLCTIKEKERNRMRNTDEAREGHEKGTVKRKQREKGTKRGTKKLTLIQFIGIKNRYKFK